MICISVIVNAHEKYKENWESLNSAPVPSWFNEAKIGLYIFWGPYSVPAYDAGYGYAEWYGNAMYKEGHETREHHLKTYGDTVDYEDFAAMWKAENWNPDEWADIFKNSGARYIISVAKYHDGFCLFPTRYDNRTSRLEKWNCIDIGPKRDIINELFSACNKKGLKMGVYMSLYEWWHPLWTNEKTREEYVNKVLHPQFKELINNYKPYFVFMDGDWMATYDVFKSTELVSWLLNDSPVKDYVAFNDRWGKIPGGKTGRGLNGMIYNTEFGGGKGYSDHAWQEDRSFGPSYGYNRNLKIKDYDSPSEVIRMIAQVSSKGGNLLLGVGPDADGTIPEIYQIRLKQMGDWLKINGEAIYGSTRWEKTEQKIMLNSTQIDTTIDFDWDRNSPLDGCEKFNIVWDGTIQVPQTGTYMFKFDLTGEGKVTINDSVIINRTGKQKRLKGAIRLESDERYPIKIEVKHDHFITHGYARLYYALGDSEFRIVPGTSFFIDEKSNQQGLMGVYFAEAAEVYFTKKGKYIYAIVPELYKDQLVLKGVNPKTGSKIVMLGLEDHIEWQGQDENVCIKVPAINNKDAVNKYGSVFRIEIN